MQVFMDQHSTSVTARIRMPWIQQPSVCLWMLCAPSKSTECYGLARHVALSLFYAGINQIEMKPIVSLDARSTISENFSDFYDVVWSKLFELKE